MTEVEDSSNILPRREVVYCGACGMPPEYCEYGPDFETHCDPWLAKHHPDLHEQLASTRSVKAGETKKKEDKPVKVRPSEPWTVEERLTAFYEKYVPEKIDSIPSLLEKYAGKEDKLFQALVKKYGPEPEDPYYASDDDDDSDDDGESEDDEGMNAGEEAGDGKKKKNRRGVAAKKKGGDPGAIRVVIKKEAQKKRRNLTIVSGMETVPNLKLKDASKALSKKFAGSSSVKENKGVKEIILQGDHMYDVAEMIVDKFGVPESCVFLDMDGEVVPFR